MNKLILILLVLLGVVKINAQDFKPFIITPYFDIVTEIIPLQNGGFVTMEVIPGKVLSTFEILSPEDIDNYGFSNIAMYNANGIKIKSLKLPDTDSTVFYTTQMILLSNGSYCIAGEHINNITGVHKLFFAIIDSQLNGIENLNIIDHPNNQGCGAVLEYYNGDLIFKMHDGHDKIKQYTKNGTFVREFNLSTSASATCLGISSGVKPNTMHHLNKNLYFYCGLMDRFLVLDELFHQSSIDLNYFPSLGYKKIKYLSQEAVHANFNEILFKAAIVGTTNTDSVYAAIFKIDTFNNVTPFYSDTLKSISGHTFHYRSPVSIGNNKIYAVYNDDFLSKTNFVVYSLNSNGSLNWKKHLSLNASVSKHTGYLTGNCITSDGSFLFTLLVDDVYGNSDVYYYKIDSLGNLSDFETGIFSFGPKLEVNDFGLFPNPIQNKLSIETALKGSFKLKVFDALGKQITTYTFENSTSLNVEKLNQGIYFYTISNQEDEQLQEGKFLKE